MHKPHCRSTATINCTHRSWAHQFTNFRCPLKCSVQRAGMQRVISMSAGSCPVLAHFRCNNIARRMQRMHHTYLSIEVSWRSSNSFLLLPPLRRHTMERRRPLNYCCWWWCRTLSVNLDNIKSWAERRISGKKLFFQGKMLCNLRHQFYHSFMNTLTASSAMHSSDRREAEKCSSHCSITKCT